MLYVMSRTLSGGPWVGIASVLGTAGGGLLHVLAAALGVSALIATSALALFILKWMGAAFLVYLGLRILLAAAHSDGLKAVPSTIQPQSLPRVFLEGVITEALNPKTALFFLAFLPQFISSDAHNLMVQLILFGGLVVLLNTVPDMLLVAGAGAFAHRWHGSARWRRLQTRLCGACIMGLGVYLASSRVGEAMR